jgi:hypothetical protein
MKHFKAFLQKIPAILSSTLSIAIFLFLFVYLVVYALISSVVPALQSYQPSNTMQLIMGNYTNVVSALGASIAAGTGAAAHSSLKKLHKRHDELKASISELHSKLDSLAANNND